jgi:UDP-N-acetylglucosamine diphosphorylase/glucosamine-1-phosphate N-acetyltransferase
MSHLILLDDGYTKLSPLTDLQASFELRTGALTTAERLGEQLGRHAAGLIVPEPLAELMKSRHPEPVNVLPAGETFVIVNGRWTRMDRDVPKLNAAIVDTDGSLIIAHLDRHHASAFVSSGGRNLAGVQTDTFGGGLMTRPWQLLQRATENLDFDLRVLAKRLRPLEGEPAPRVTVVGKHRVYIGQGTVVHPNVVFDTSAGPIAIDDGAEIRSMGVLVGPGYIGRKTAIANHAHIRGHCVIGPVCKVGGEVNSSVFQGYSNKAHSGYLGNSYVGEWVNLGADTVTSNLKNTYGEIRMQLTAGSAPEATGMRYLGSILGDHVKTAIGTKLQTGTMVQTGAMVAVGGFPPKFVRAFAFLTDEGETKYELDKFMEVAETMMGRREVEVSEALRERLRVVHSGG